MDHQVPSEMKIKAFQKQISEAEEESYLNHHNLPKVNKMKMISYKDLPTEALAKISSQNDLGWIEFYSIEDGALTKIEAYHRMGNTSFDLLLVATWNGSVWECPWK